MGRILDATKQFFTEDNWPIREDDDSPMLTTKFSGDNGEWYCHARAREEEEQFTFYSVCTGKCPVEKRPMMAEFLSRANWGLVVGNFELDVRDGEVRYKTSIDVEDCEITPTLIKRCVYPNVLTMDKYLPGIMSIIYADTTPESEIQRIEGDA